MQRLQGLLEGEWSRLPLWLPVALGAGIIAYFAQRQEPGALWGMVSVPLLLGSLGLRGRPLPAWLLALAGMGFLGFGVAGWQASRMPAPLDLPRRAVVLEGRVEAVDTLPKGLRVTLGEVRLGPGEPPLARRIRIRLRPNDPLHPAPGESLRMRALVREPSAPPAPGGWDFQRDAFFSGLGGSGFALGPSERLGEAARPPVFAAARAWLQRRVLAALPGGPGAVAAALLTGGQSAIPAPDIQAMRDSGLAHLLSVSGLHIAIVMGLGFGILRFGVALVPALALRWDSKRIAAPGALLLGGAYMLLTGAQVPMQRSFAMAALVTFGILIGRRALSLRALALAAAAVMLAQPAALLGPSFQMSFAAVLVLIAGAEATGPLLARWRQGTEWWRRPALVLLGMVLTSLLAGLATLPYGLHHFGRLQLYGLAANMVAVPLTSMLVMPAGMLAVALMPFGLEAWPLTVMGWGVEGVLRVAHTVASWPGAALTAMPIPAWGLLLTSFGLLWLCLWQARWRLLGLPLAAAGVFSALTVTPPDILVSADARLIALRTPQGVVLQRASGASNFLRDNWLRGWGEEEADLLPASGEHEEAGLDCPGLDCRFQPRPDGPAAMLMRTPKPRRGEKAAPVQAARACGQAAVLVSAEPVRGRCPGTAVVDRFSVWRNGPHAVWLGHDGVRVVSDRDWRGARPWVPPPPRPAWEKDQ
ncbi:ComEC family competence protein [Roseomonas sp. M0104]|uniref:ComEC family competence protein n=2 Tax=Teichococcus coralli TaxID=2545983 RepID=A0A845B6V9_9PROT|nr:ComEC family competence protein [Pseudoroseomonas coralli]